MDLHLVVVEQRLVFLRHPIDRFQAVLGGFFTDALPRLYGVDHDQPYHYGHHRCHDVNTNGTSTHWESLEMSLRSETPLIKEP